MREAGILDAYIDKCQLVKYTHVRRSFCIRLEALEGWGYKNPPNPPHLPDVMSRTISLSLSNIRIDSTRVLVSSITPSKSLIQKPS